MQQTIEREGECAKCHGTGLVTIPNGTDDYDEEFCYNCPAGERLAEQFTGHDNG